VPNRPNPGIKRRYQSIQTSRSSHSDGWNPMVRLTSFRTLEQRAPPDVDWSLHTRPHSFSRTIRDIWDDVATASWTPLPQIPPNSGQGPTNGIRGIDDYVTCRVIFVLFLWPIFLQFGS